MASQWEMAMGVELGMGLGGYHDVTGAGAPMTHHAAGTYSAAAHHFYGMQPMGDHAGMRVDELLDLASAGAHDFFPVAADNGNQYHHLGGAGVGTGEPSAATTPSATSSDHQTSMLSFADEFYIPREEAAELEWLSKFVDDSYSDMPNYCSASHAAMAAAAANAASNGCSGGQDSCVTAAPGRGARSKRSRAGAAAANAWHSLVPSQPSPSSSSCSSSDFPSSAHARPSNGGSNGGNRNRKQGPSMAGGEVGLVEGGVRRCTHCASEKTPQWRTGPLGPKTLCNACGVRFKSGRLVPEYRPAASPTFLLTQHSNSHRKVMELRRQKEMVLIRGSHHRVVDPAGAGGGVDVKPELSMFRDYGIC
ncbi:GATA transcription factor 2-like [Lolium rigidum]|uniref:GATA transcription factor 2-like n=1 Tax=Lolium rigidum TaxID=89674 RepID=UPI001F5CFA83|nr:GATA transcription factor 2-like [Lolium rigidum]